MVQYETLVPKTCRYFCFSSFERRSTVNMRDLKQTHAAVLWMFFPPGLHAGHMTENDELSLVRLAPKLQTSPISN